MIETIRTFTGVVRQEGRAVVTEGRALRCTDCGLITVTKKEMSTHTCTKENIQWQKKLRTTKTNSAVK